MPVTPPILRRYRAGNNLFIGTGTYAGDGVKEALAAGFKQVITMDVRDSQVRWARDHYKDDPVEVWHGSPHAVLSKLLPTIKERATFWLDAHWSGVVSFILDELEAITTMRDDSPTILIDNLQRYRQLTYRTMDREPVTEAMLKTALLKINPDYLIESIDSPAGADEILTAVVLEIRA